MPFTITLPNGDTISYPDGVPQEAIRADIEQKIARGELPDPRLGDPMQEGTSQPIQVGPDAERNALRTGLKMTELASGFLPGGPLVRIPAAAIAGLLTGALTGEDEGEGLERGAWQGGLQATGEFLPPVINKGFQGAGLLLGGRSKDLAKTAATFAKERLPIGATGRMAARRKGLNPQLKELEGAIPCHDSTSTRKRSSFAKWRQTGPAGGCTQPSCQAVSWGTSHAGCNDRVKRSTHGRPSQGRLR